jgi:uncharacterized protein (DUF1330 family)
MAAYVILHVDVTDPGRYGEYVKAAGDSVARYGGRYIVRGGRAERLEGVVEPKRVVVIEFDTFDRARAWWSSAEYAGPKGIRQSAARTEALLVEGV